MPEFGRRFLQHGQGAGIFLVAASGATLERRLASNWIGQGTADDVDINAAIAALPAGAGKVVLSEGTFSVVNNIEFPLPTNGYVLQGQGKEATQIQTSTAGLNVLELHGAGGAITSTNYQRRCSVRDLAVVGIGASPVNSVGLSLYYADAGDFANLWIKNFYTGLKSDASFDHDWHGIWVEDCGHAASSSPAVLLTGNAEASGANSNNHRFFGLRIERFNYRALEILTDATGGPSSHNRFYGLKVHGDDGASNADGIYLDSMFCVFQDLSLDQLGDSNTGLIIASQGDHNQISNLVFSKQTADIVVDIQAGAAYNIIQGLTAHGQTTSPVSDIITGVLLVAGSDNVISGVTCQYVAGYGMKVSGNRNQVANCKLSAQGQGLWVTGSNNEFTNVSPFWAGLDGGGAAVVAGDSNRFFGGKVSGTGGKTMDFSGDDNLAVGTTVDTTIIDTGVGNRVIEIEGSPSTVDDRHEVLLAAEGLIAEVFPRLDIVASSLGIDGTVYYMAVALLAGEVVTNISVIVNTAGVTMTLSKVGLYDSAFTRLALSADQTTAWESTGVKTIALTSPYTVLTTGLYYVAIVAKGATIPAFSRTGTVALAAVAIGSGARPFAHQTGQTDLPATGTPAVTAPLPFWAGIS